MTNAYFLLVLREFGMTPEARAAILEGIDARATIAAGEITLGDQIRQVRNVNRREPPGGRCGSPGALTPPFTGPSHSRA